MIHDETPVPSAAIMFIELRIYGKRATFFKLLHTWKPAHRPVGLREWH